MNSKKKMDEYDYYELPEGPQEPNLNWYQRLVAYFKTRNKNESSPLSTLLLDVSNINELKTK